MGVWMLIGGSMSEPHSDVMCWGIWYVCMYVGRYSVMLQIPYIQNSVKRMPPPPPLHKKNALIWHCSRCSNLKIWQQNSTARIVTSTSSPSFAYVSSAASAALHNAEVGEAAWVWCSPLLWCVIRPNCRPNYTPITSASAYCSPTAFSSTASASLFEYTIDHLRPCLHRPYPDSISRLALIWSLKPTQLLCRSIYTAKLKPTYPHTEVT